jgi:hypothetical protein
MSTLRLNRGESVSVPFLIASEAGGLAGKRVTWSLAHSTGDVPALVKKSDLGVSSVEVLIASITDAEIIGSILMLAADFDELPEGTYAATLWVDSDTGDDACVTPGGADLVLIVPTVDREP